MSKREEKFKREEEIIGDSEIKINHATETQRKLRTNNINLSQDFNKTK